MTQNSPARRLLAAAGLLVAALVACGREVTAPNDGTINPGNAFRRAGLVAIDPKYETAIPAPLLRAALAQVPFTKVHIVLKREDGTIAVDKFVDFPDNATELSLTLDVPLPSNTPAGGSPFKLQLDYVNAAGETVFSGSSNIVVKPISTTNPTPTTPEEVKVSYTGPGANATAVVIGGAKTSGLVGDVLNFSATATGSNGSPIANTPIVFASTNTAVLTVANAAVGSVQLVGPGSGDVCAQLLTGPKDCLKITVTRPAAKLAVIDGNDQTALANTTLPKAIIAHVSASDGTPVQGVAVSFGVTAGGGTVAPLTGTTDVNGDVSTTWKLGPTAGQQTMAVTSGSLVGSPAIVRATATVLTATRLDVTTQPANGTVGAALAPVAVTAKTQDGQIVTGFTGDVTVAFGANPGSATLGGTLTVKAINGVATFSDLTVSKVGTGYTLDFTSTGLSHTVSNAFNIVAGSAAKLSFTTPPGDATAGVPFVPALVVTATDASGNTQSSFTGDVTLALGANAGASTLQGTLTRKAVNGVATFNDVSLTKKGTGFSLVASSSGLASATSGTFAVAAGAPRGIVVTGGAGQTKTAGSALNPITVQLQDQFGNGVPGLTVAFAVQSGGGSVNVPSATTDANGEAQVTWTIGNGTQVLRASYNAIFFDISATSTGVVAGAATQLIVTGQPTVTQTAGTAGGNIVVAAKDASGNVATTFTGAVALAINTGPVGATVIGPVSANAVAGIATFGGVSFDKAGAYTLKFTSGALTQGNSNSFTVGAGAAANIAADSGSGQAGAAGQPLPAQIVVRVTDTYGNPVSGTTVTWTPKPSSGSLSGTTTSTDAAGRARTTWTLGTTYTGVNADTLDVSSGTLAGSPVRFFATGNVVAYNKAWTGATNTDWDTGTNWSPTGAPATTDSVLINNVANAPILATSQSIAKLTVAAGASLTLNNYLTVNGSVNALVGSSINGSGVLELKGATGTIVGPSYPYTNFYGNYTFAGATTFNGGLEAKTGGVVNTASSNITVTGSLSTGNNGVLVQAGGTITVSGNVYFGGGDETGKLTGGTLNVGGNFTQAVGSIASTFVGQSSHTVNFTGASGHTVSFADPTQSMFNHVFNVGSGTLTFSTNVRVLGTLNVPTGGGSIVATNRRVFLGSGLSDVPGNGTSFNADTVELISNAAVTLPAILNAGLVVSGTTATLQSDVRLAGAVRVAGVLDLNGHTVITPRFSTTGSGVLKMINGSNADALYVNGPVTFGGGDESGLLTAGTIHVRGDFTQLNTGTGTDNSFRATGSHTVAFDSALTAGAVHAVSFASPDTALGAGCLTGFSCFNNVSAAHLGGTSGATIFSTGFKALGAVDLTGSGVDSVSTPNPARPTGATSSIAVVQGQWSSGCCTPRRFNRVAVGSTAFGGVSGVAIDTLIFYGTGQDFQPNGNAIGASAVRISGTASTAASNLVFSGPVSVDGSTAVLDIGSPGGKLVVSAFKTKNGGKLKMTNATDTLSVTGNADFAGGATSGLLTAGALVVGGNFSATGTSYDASGTHSTIMQGNTGTQTIAWTTPTAGKGHHDLIVQNAAARQFSGDQYITGNVIMGASATSGTLSGSYNIFVGGAVLDSTGLGTGGWTGSSMITFTGNPAELPAKLQVNTLKFLGGGTTSLVRNLATNYVIVDGTGSRLKLNGHVLTTNGNDFTTQNAGTLDMTTAGDSVLTGRAFFNGGSTVGLLTTGSFATGFLSQAGAATAYAPDSTHKTWLSSGNTVLISFTNPDSGTAGSHFGTLMHNTSSTVNLGSTVIVEGQLRTTTGVQFPLASNTASSRLLVARGAAVNHLYSNNVRLRLNNGQAVSQLDDIKFTNMVVSDTQFIIARSGTGTAGSVPTINGILFNTAPTSGFYLYGHDTDGASPNALTINLGGTFSPIAHSGFAIFDNGATSNWPAAVTVTAASSGDWSVGSTWVGGVAPGPNDDVVIGNGLTVTLDADVSAHAVTVNGTLYTGPISPAHTVTIKGNLTGTGTVTGNGSVSMGGTGTLQNLSVSSLPDLSVLSTALVQLGANVESQNNVALAGKLVVNGHALSVWNLLSTSGTGGLKMVNAADSVDVYDAQFAGAASDTLLTDGVLVISDAIDQNTNAKAFAPTGSHRTKLLGGGFALLRAGQRAGARVRGLTEEAVSVRRNRRFTNNGVSFANPGYATSHFNILQFGHTNDASVVFDTDVYANSVQTIGMTSQRSVYSGSSINFHFKSVDLLNLTFNNMNVQVDSGGTWTQFQGAQFWGQDVTKDFLTVVLANGATGTIASPAFFNDPTTGHYLVTKTASAGTATLNISSPFPGSHGGHVSNPSGSVTTNAWAATRTLTAGTGQWSNAATWGGNFMPSRYDDVTIPAAASVTLDVTGYAKNMTIAPSGSLDIGYQTLYSYGDWTADSASTVTASSGTIRHFNPKTVVGNIGNAYFFDDVTLATGSTTYSAMSVHIKAGLFDVNGKTFRVGGNLNVDSIGVLKMISGGALVDVANDANFGGATSDGFLTNGTLRVGGNFYQASANSSASFAASGSHKTILTGETGFGAVTFESPDSLATTSHFAELQIGDTQSQTITVNSDVMVTKKLTRGTASTMTLLRNASLGASIAPTIYTADLASTASLIFDRTRLFVYDLSSSSALSNATFQNFTNTAFENQMTLRYRGATNLINNNFSSIAFTTSAANTYNYVWVDRVGTGTLTMTFSSMTPSQSLLSGKLALTGTPSVTWLP